MDDFFEGVVEFFSDLFVFSSTSRRDKKIDRHITMLRKEAWFNSLFRISANRKLIFNNRKVRRYLKSRRRVKRLIEDVKAQRHFQTLLKSCK
ncbi:hypothetical protein LRR81_13325 [Metabacillus sp. GX 13764]|uniref:hypothetical protein n=1 Tax=Metabacillus kandeliae TaxID=2900151 RepID=UPI001E401554|nr:hypothetical protein [Metabacillus kandeliae]MCD7035222.1 hypothetical protein [Metabacillus kandeliae]